MLTTPEVQGSNQLNTLTDVDILLTVKASKLFPLRNPSQSDIANFTQLFDGKNTCPFGESKANFITDVFLNHNVKWKAVLFDHSGADKDYSVEVLAYNYKNTTNSRRIFSQDRINRSNGKVEGRVLNDPELLEKLNDYGIEFKMTHERNGSKTIDMDPKLKVKPRQ
ncbi:MAG: hypothetical protein KJO41_00805 [Bacteroidia bacterium]|nr:hypothetical protein [Bacteroidia bacterium]MBT8277509.1 hypothetical protein [Bacteroidia bacterium]NND25436.1 hypothetical protein [Flavobacteriaceae bacterium]NNK60606.1 hypothetical protein [Flavobacteriaceae bacterium]NNL34132.1 hypothetical protein [Flavobacteriaceae bacterium]